MKIITLDGSRMPDVETAHRYIAEQLGFPAGEGLDLKSLGDCLSRLGTMNDILLIHVTWMKHQLGAYADELIQTFETASKAPASFLFTADVV